MSLRQVTGNRSQIDSWLWRARYHIRKGNAALAFESMLAAAWLMGAPATSDAKPIIVNLPVTE